MQDSDILQLFLQYIHMRGGGGGNNKADIPENNCEVINKYF